MTVVDRFVQAVAHGGVMAKPTLIVVHSAETPLKAGYANSMAVNWFGLKSSGVTTSAQFMVDPRDIIRMLSDNVVAYAVGPNANGFTLNIEQSGYANFTRAQWTTADGLVQLGKVGALIAELAARWSIPLRYASDADIRSAAKGVPGGICFHNDIHRVLGGTTHTDPMPNYPHDLLAQAWAGEDDDMPTLDEIWSYPINGVQARDRLQGIDNLTQTISTRQVGYGNRTEDIQARVTQVQAAVTVLPDAVLNRSVPNAERSDPKATTSLGAQVSWTDAHVDSVTKRLDDVESKLDQILRALSKPTTS